MKVKRFYLRLVSCFVLGFCLIFGSTLSVNAANGDILYSGSGSDWTCTTDNAIFNSYGVLNYNHVNVVFYYSIPASYIDSYSGDFIDVTCSNLYVPLENNSGRSQISYDSSSGIFMNGNRVSEFTFMGSLFNAYYTFINNGITDSGTHYYTFQYLRDFTFTISKSDLVYVPSLDIYSLRITVRYYVASPNFALYKLRKTNANQFNVNDSGYSYWLDLNSFPNYSLVLKESTSVPSSSVSTNDSSTQNAINNQTSKVEEGNQIAEQGNTIAEQGNDIAQENADTNKDTNNKITSFFNSFFDNLVHIFVPEDGFFSSWFNDLNDFFAQKLGFLYSPFDFIISFFNGVLNTVGTQEHGFTIPALSWDGMEFCPEVHFSFDTFSEQFPQLQEAVYFFSDVVIILALMRGIKSKLDLVMGVHEE